MAAHGPHEALRHDAAQRTRQQVRAEPKVGEPRYRPGGILGMQG